MGLHLLLATAYLLLHPAAFVLSIFEFLRQPQACHTIFQPV